MKKLTVIITVFNESHNIEGVLESANFADEIIVVDSFSTDDTLLKAKKYTNLILQRKYEYPASQKNWAIPQAGNEWILLLDADERVTPELKSEILKILENPPSGIAGFWIYRNNHFMGKQVHFSGWQHDKVIRLFKRDECVYEDKMVHEELTSNGEIGFLKNKLYHNTYVNLDNYIQKLNRYAYWQALDYDKHTNRLNAFHFIIKPVWRFFKHYILQQGFRDGVIGLTISVLQSYALFMRYVKLWLYRRGQK